MTRTVALGIAWNWEFDTDFIHTLEIKCQQSRLSTYLINPENLSETIDFVKKNEITFATFFDRASDDDFRFQTLIDELHRKGTYIFNDPPLLPDARDKSIMHNRLMLAGIHVPYTVVIPPYDQEPEVEIGLQDLARLGNYFIVKPSTITGGGRGVRPAETIEDILQARQLYPQDSYLLQRNMTPISLNDKPAWFRSYYVFNKVIPCWWDPVTHIYETLSRNEQQELKLLNLNTIMRKIQMLSKLDFFSSEIVKSRDGFYVIDYVNEVPDMRLSTKYIDGVPDIVVEQIQGLIVKEVSRHMRHY